MTAAKPIPPIGLDDLPEEARQIAEVIGVDNLLALSDALGGEQLYVPRPERLAAARRNREIRAAFNGRNYRELAQRHGLTVRWIRTIVAGGDAPEEKPDSESIYKQAKLF